jgi:hypothetical protein
MISWLDVDVVEKKRCVPIGNLAYKDLTLILNAFARCRNFTLAAFAKCRNMIKKTNGALRIKFFY